LIIPISRPVRKYQTLTICISNVILTILNERKKCIEGIVHHPFQTTFSR
jgi:hypothetical protein